MKLQFIKRTRGGYWAYPATDSLGYPGVAVWSSSGTGKVGTISHWTAKAKTVTVTAHTRQAAVMGVYRKLGLEEK